MGIDISAYKMVYQDLVYNCVSVTPTWSLSGAGELSELEVFYIDTNNRLRVVKDKASEFQFISK